MAEKNWVVIILALLFWAAFFYLMDRSLMNSQGLPVGADLMPL